MSPHVSSKRHAPRDNTDRNQKVAELARLRMMWDPLVASTSPRDARRDPGFRRICSGFSATPAAIAVPMSTKR